MLPAGPELQGSAALRHRAAQLPPQNRSAPSLVTPTPPGSLLIVGGKGILGRPRNRIEHIMFWTSRQPRNTPRISQGNVFQRPRPCVSSLKTSRMQRPGLPTPDAGRTRSRGSLHPLPVAMRDGQPLRRQTEIARTFTVHLPLDPVLALPGIYPGDVKTRVHRRVLERSRQLCS